MRVWHLYILETSEALCDWNWKTVSLVLFSPQYYNLKFLYVHNIVNLFTWNKICIPEFFHMLKNVWSDDTLKSNKGNIEGRTLWINIWTIVNQTIEKTTQNIWWKWICHTEVCILFRFHLIWQCVHGNCNQRRTLLENALFFIPKD